LWKIVVGICLGYTLTRTRLNINQECIAQRQSLAYILMHIYNSVCIFKRCILYFRHKCVVRRHMHKQCMSIRHVTLKKPVPLVSNDICLISYFQNLFSCPVIHVVVVKSAKTLVNAVCSLKQKLRNACRWINSCDIRCLSCLSEKAI